MSVAQDTETTPRRIGVYRLDAEIGAGAMGKVYRATHETLGKPVALKIVHADDPSGEVSARFLQEGIAASKVRHPNVVEILDAGTHKGTAYMAMQLLDGETLAECLSRQGRLPPTYAVDLILPVCAALVAAHESGVLHRDLKPANIFLADVGRGDPEPILLDFGISKILGPVDPELTQNPKFLGSPLYIAPEQADGAPGSPLSDQYSLALSLYETLLGVKPFAKYSSSLIQLLRHVAEGEIRRPRELDASIPNELDLALMKALSTKPKDRFPSMRDFGAALLPFASQARRTLWQQSFVDAERTMTSANAPISDSTRSSRRVQVSVEESPSTSPSGAATVPGTRATGDPDDFLSHSSLFGAEESPEDFDAARSSISRRDPFSQVPSERSSGAWSEEEQGTDPSLQRRTWNSEAPQTRAVGPGAPRRSYLGALALLGFALAVLIALRPWSSGTPADYAVHLQVTPAEARIEIDGQFVGNGRFDGKFKRNGSAHRARVSMKGYEAQTLVFRDQPPVESVALAPIQDAAAPAQLKEPRVEPAKPPAPPETKAKDNPARKASIAPKKPPQASAAAQPPTPEAEPPSDPAPEAVSKSTEAEQPADKSTGSKPSLSTGNLDPWAQ